MHDVENIDITSMKKTAFDDEEKRIRAEIQEQSLLDKLQPLKDNFVGNFGHPICRKCIKKYNKERGGHRIDCRGIPQGLDWVPPAMRAKMTDEELTQTLITLDPVRWAKVYFGWEARDYQVEYLQCTARRKANRWSRRGGKTEVVVVEMLHGIVTQAYVPVVDGQKRGCKILVFTPYNDQVTNVFKKIENFLDRNSKIANMVTRYVRSPYMMEFDNGGWIMGKPAGTKSGAGGASSRGWGADRYVIDEGDYLHDNDYAAFIPMLTEHPNTRFTVISTPCGKRQKFYHLCNSNLYKEMWVPCYQRPDWTPQVEEESRAECPTELDFIHEFEADWGVAEQGVFNLTHVLDSQYDYAYWSDPKPEDLPQFHRDPSWTYCIGADLNESYGIAAVVLGWNPEDEYWYIVDRAGVEKSEYTQISGMELIVDLNRRWRPDWIYFDKKPSSTAFEVLKRYGIEQSRAKGENARMDARLAHILKQYDFGAKIEGPDLTGKIVKRTVKPFMVGIAVRRFEQRQIRMPRKDELLFQQIIDYEQKVTPANNVIYIPSNLGDHYLDGFLLALLAFAVEMSELGGGRTALGVSFGPSFGKPDSTLKTQETTIVERSMHFVPSQRHNIYARMKQKMHMAMDTRASKRGYGGNKREIKTNLRRY